MANQQETRKDLTAKVLKATKAEGKNGPYWEFDLVEQGQERAYTWRMFDAKAGEAVAVGTTYRFTAWTKPTDRGGIFRNLYKAEPVSALPSDVTQPGTADDRIPKSVHEMDQLEKQRSIERQKALAEARSAADFLMGQWFKDNRDIPQQGRAGQEMPWPVFEATFLPSYEALVSKLATRFYKSIKGERNGDSNKA